MKPMEHSAFPSDETLAAFIDGHLDEETRKRVVAHVADCEDCYGTVMAAGAWKRDGDAMGASRAAFRFPSTKVWAGLAVAAGLAGMFLYQPLRVEYRRYHAEAAIRKAVNSMSNRVADARLSLDLEFKPPPPRFRGSEDDSEDLGLLAAGSEVQENARGDVRGNHSLGVVLLLTGKRQEAAALLGKAVMDETGAPNIAEAISHCTDVPLLSDLSAAEGAVTDHSTDESAARIALAAAKRAWQLDPKSPITVWNRAVATERLDPHAAIDAWRDYVAIDRTTAWSGAAKERIERLQHPD